MKDRDGFRDKFSEIRGSRRFNDEITLLKDSRNKNKASRSFADLTCAALKTDFYSGELKPLVARTVEIARARADAYIRHRAKFHLGNEKIYKPLPPISES